MTDAILVVMPLLRDLPDEVIHALAYILLTLVGIVICTMLFLKNE